MNTPQQRVALVKTSSCEGTGVRITSRHVLTCAHVVGKSKKIQLRGLEFIRVVAVDRKADLALLEVREAVDLAPAEWVEDVPVGGQLELFGFPGGAFTHTRTTVRATHSNHAGLRVLELPALTGGGFSGGLAVLAGDPLACAGLVRMGESETLSTLIGVGEIRQFLREKCGGIELPMRGTATDTQTVEYLRQLREEHGFIDLRKLRIETGSVKHARIEDIYIPLSTGAIGVSKGRTEPEMFWAMIWAKSRLLESVLSAQRVLIQGEAGSGKSTFLKRVAYELAGGEAGRLPALPVPGLFPIFVRVTDLEKHRADCGDNEVRKLAHFLSARHELDIHFFQRKLSEAGTLVLLDGMDESPTLTKRLETMALIERIAVKYPHCRFAITTRPRAGVTLRGFETATIEPLSDESRTKFVADWTRFLFPDEAEATAAKHRDEILTALTERSEIDEMSRNPLMLTALAALYWVRRTLPVVRAELYQAILQWLVEVRPRDGERVASQDCLDYLGELAYGMQTSETGRRGIEKGDAAELMTMCPSKAKALQFLDREEVDSGIIVSENTSIKFWHLQFQEFLAARHLAGMGDAEQYAEILRDGRLFQSEWREVVRLYAGILACNQSKRKAEAAVRRILDITGPGLADRARSVALLHAINMDLRALPFRISDERYWAMVHSMQELFHVGAERVELADKVAAAEAMDMLERHPLLRLPSDPDYWVSIAGGAFTMGAQKKDPAGPNYDPEAFVGEPVRAAAVDDFHIGRYPVTVYEYGAYVATGGTEPEQWRQQKEWPSRPVVGVSWENACQYCAWVGSVRLPSEEDWELAARGKEGRKYPWGDKPEPDEERANFLKKVGRPTAVGVFPKGETPEGVSDLAGNVWEWTSSDHERGGKVLRGGSFVLDAWSLRGALRIRLEPDAKYGFLGFRVVRE